MVGENAVIECEDFYAISNLDEGCCLKCSEAEPGCLCTECCCSKCYWYLSPDEWDGEKGKCGKVLEFKKEKENIKKTFQENKTNYERRKTIYEYG